MALVAVSTGALALARWSPAFVSSRAELHTRIRPISASSVSFATTSVSVEGISVPVAVWCPEDLLPDACQRTEEYIYTVDVGRIATKLEVEWLSWLPSRTFKLERATVQDSDPPAAAPGDALLFAHGFLGSPFDMAHACEALASDGFLVVAPELPESLAASYEARVGVDREAIVRATQEAIGSGAGGDASRLWGIFGHSAGSATALLQPGEFGLGRVCMATALGRCLEAQTSDPLFLVSSEGDGCNRKMREKGVPLPRDALTLARVNRAPAFTTFESAEEAYSRSEPRGALPRRGVLLFRAGSSPLPNHISFLWSRTNEAMFELLSVLLPLARGLDLFLLDFDQEMDARLAEPTAAKLVPALRRFFGGFREEARLEAEEGGR